MTQPLRLHHTHLPLYRVVRRSWSDPLNVSHSQTRVDNRWNTADFPALYCCCSTRVARAVVLDVFRFTGVEMSELQLAARPQLIEISWRGDVIDMVSEMGIAGAGFPADYPLGVSKERTRLAAIDWHAAGENGVVARSASLGRLGFSGWNLPHDGWGELAIFPQNSESRPRLLRRRDDLDWLEA